MKNKTPELTPLQRALALCEAVAVEPHQLVDARQELDRLKSIEGAALALDDVWGWVTIAHEDNRFIKARARLAAALASTPVTAHDYVAMCVQEWPTLDRLVEFAQHRASCRKLNAFATKDTECTCGLDEHTETLQHIREPKPKGKK